MQTNNDDVMALRFEVARLEAIKINCEAIAKERDDWEEMHTEVAQALQEAEQKVARLEGELARAMSQSYCDYECINGKSHVAAYLDCERRMVEAQQQRDRALAAMEDMEGWLRAHAKAARSDEAKSAYAKALLEMQLLREDIRDAEAAPGGTNG